MRGNIAGLSSGVRVALGFMTVVLLLFFGQMFLESHPTLGWAFLALGVLRFGLWVRDLSRRIKRVRAREEDWFEDEPEELSARADGGEKQDDEDPSSPDAA